MSSKPKLTEMDIAKQAGRIGCEPAVLKAILQVEAPRGGFEPDGQCVILFERHKFSKHTGGKYDKSHPLISNPVAGGYGSFSSQHKKLQAAAALDREAALKSASWGIPQILGSNYAVCGCKSLQEFINKMHESEASQLELMANFIMGNPVLHAAVRTKNWEKIAECYNGRLYRKHNYHGRLFDAYRKHAKGVA